MATRDGKEVLQCERCTLHKDDVKAYTVVKGEDREARRLLCESCKEITEGVYTVKAASRRSATDEPKEQPLSQVSTESTAERRLMEAPPEPESKRRRS